MKRSNLDKPSLFLAISLYSLGLLAVTVPYHAHAEVLSSDDADTSEDSLSDGSTTGNSDEAAASKPLTKWQARYFLTRVGFDPNNAELKELMALPSREAAVDEVLNVTRAINFVTRQPAWVHLTWQQYQQSLCPSNTCGATPAARSIASTAAGDVTRQALRNWWAVQLAQTKTPTAERMVLFWHNLFPATDEWNWFFYNQDMKIRRNAIGNYKKLYTDMIYDSNILEFLGQNHSTPAYPTANLAREMMELFSIGIGNYSEEDVIEVSKALTGLTINPVTGIGYFNPAMHDNSQKTILGQTGNWGPDDVIRILFEQPSLAPRIVTMLWQEFVSSTPNTATVNQIADSFKKDWEIQPVLKALFLTPEFWARASRGTLVKSPAEFVIGAVRGELNMAKQDDMTQHGTDLTSMIWGTGEPLWMPPNVRGFLTGTNWINTATLEDRQQAAMELTSEWTTEILNKRYTTLPVINPSQYERLAKILMGDQPILASPTQVITIQQAAKMIMLDPSYWLK